MKKRIFTLFLAIFTLTAQAAPLSVSGNWSCQTVSYRAYGNNYLIFIDKTHWQHKADSSLHGEGKLEVHIHGKNVQPVRLYFDYASDGYWRQIGDRLLMETIKPRLVPAAKNAAQLRMAAENIARDVNSKPQQTVASNIIFLSAKQLIMEDRESHDFTRCSR